MSMNYPVIVRSLGFVSIILSIMMLPSLIISAVLSEDSSMSAFLLTILFLMGLGAFLALKIKPQSTKLRIRDGIFLVAMTWIFSTVVGTMPYMLSGEISSWADALFESASGFTTSGATIFTDVERLPKSLLFWRSLSQWLGGMGLIMFATSLFPVLGIHGQTLADAETSTPRGKYSAHFFDTAKLLYSTYLILTIVCIGLLFFNGLNLFDSFIFGFSSIASGGLSNYNDGISHFDNRTVEWIVAVFSLFACVNFTLYIALAKGRFRDFLRDTELRAFLGILGTGAALIIWNLSSNHVFDSFLDTLHHGLFQTVSFMTTTGYCSTALENWPSFSKFILFALCFIGGCTSSTSGGIKVNRIVILFKLLWRGFYRRIHPNAMMTVKLQGRAIAFDLVAAITTFISAYLGVFLLGCLALSLENLDMLTTISASAALLSNTGTGFGQLAVGNFSFFSPWSKIFMALEMILGRLEIFTILLLFTRKFWNPDK